MYNVHDTSNGSPIYNNISRNEHMTPTNGRDLSSYRHLPRFTNSNLGSQSETNIPNLNNFSHNATNFKLYTRLGMSLKTEIR